MTEVEYIVSLHPSDYVGYQSKNKNNGIVKLHISTIYNNSDDFDDFVNYCVFTLVLERICLERGFQKIRMKNRCHPCKMQKYACEMLREW